MGIEIIWGSGSPFAWRVLLTLEHKRIPYKSTMISFADGTLDTPKYLTINPRAKVPFLKHGDFTLFESLAIMQYLESLQPAPALFGENPADTGSIWRSIMETSGYIEEPAFAMARAVFFDRINENADAVAVAKEQLTLELTRVNAELETTGYLVGDSLTAADIALYPLLQYLLRAVNKNNDEALSGKLLNLPVHFPAIHAWNIAFEALPGYKKTYPPHWASL